MILILCVQGSLFSETKQVKKKIIKEKATKNNSSDILSDQNKLHAVFYNL